MEEKMKVKKIKIKIKIMEMNKWFDHVESILKDAKKGRYSPYPRTISFSNLESARKILSPRRMQLLAVIKHQKPASIYELAKMVGRDRKAVTTDINLLEELGFVKLKKHQRERTLVTPQVPFEEVNIGIKI